MTQPADHELEPQIRQLLDSEAAISPLEADKLSRLRTRVNDSIARQYPAGLPAEKSPPRMRPIVKGALIGAAVGTLLGAASVVWLKRMEPYRVRSVLLPAEESTIETIHTVVIAVPQLHGNLAERSTMVPNPVGDRGDADLAHERALLETAKSALIRSAYPNSLLALDEHQKLYPNGRLAEERDGLRIQALLANKQIGEAQRLFVSFAHRYPQSLLLPALEATLRNKP